jgi:hypothetical protein
MQSDSQDEPQIPEQSSREPSPSDVWAALCAWLALHLEVSHDKPKWTDVVMVILTVAVALAAFWSAYLFQGQLTVLRRQFEATDRPWIKVEVSANTEYVPGAFIGGPLAFDADGTAHLTWKYTVKNIGRSVASAVHIREKLLATSPFYPDFKFPNRAQQALCEKPYSPAENSLPLVVFPDDSKQEYTSATTSTADVKDIPGPGLKRGKPVTFFLVGCVEYRFAASPVSHQTGFIYQVWGSKAHQGIQTGMTIPVDQLTFEPYYGGEYAN